MVVILILVSPRDPRRAWWFHWVVVLALLGLMAERVWQLANGEG